MTSVIALSAKVTLARIFPPASALVPSDATLMGFLFALRATQLNLSLMSTDSDSSSSDSESEFKCRRTVDSSTGAAWPVTRGIGPSVVAGVGCPAALDALAEAVECLLEAASEVSCVLL